MKHAKKIIIICLVLMISSNLNFQTLKGHIDTKFPSNVNIIDDNQNLKSIELKDTVSLSDQPTYLIKPGQEIIPIYTSIWTFPFGTRIDSISLFAEKITFKQNLKNNPISPYPYSSAHIEKEGESIHHVLLHDAYQDSPLRKWYDIRMGAGMKNNERVLFVSIAIQPLLYHSSFSHFIIPDNISIIFHYKEPLEQIPYETTYDTLIITKEKFKETLQPFIQYKQERTKILLETLENIPHQGRDIQEDIKLFIKQTIEDHNIKNVLFIGGYNEIPARNVFVQEIRSILMDDNNFISDLYYADIYDINGDFCSWDSNNNNIFGEFNFDEITPSDTVDLYPDIYFGRLACRSIEEVRTCTNKTISYENNRSNNSEWFKNAVMIGSDTFTEDIIGISEGEKITDSISQILLGFNITRLWGSNGKLQYAKDISDTIEKGAGFVAFEGHAGSNSYRTHPSQSPSEWIPLEWYRTYHINDLTNKDKLPIVSINACNTCKFSVNHTCFGWSFVINPTGGSIATIGMTCLSWIYPGIFCTYGLGGLLHQNLYRAYMSGAATFGQIWADSIVQYLNENPWYLSPYDHKTLKAWQPFGDPTLQLP